MYAVLDWLCEVDSLGYKELMVFSGSPSELLVRILFEESPRLNSILFVCLNIIYLFE